MVEFLRGLHNLLRWIVVLGGVYALAIMLRGLVMRARWTATEGTAAKIFTYSLHLQLLVGLALYAVTPLLRGGIGADLSGRLLLIEHAVTMLVAVIAAQIGTSTARRAEEDRIKFVRSLIWYAVAALLIVWATPWGRNLVPWG